MTWEEIINDPTLQNLPSKIETNRFGQILMSPATNKHGALEVWVVNQKRHVTFYSHTGQIKKSKLIPNFKL